MKYGHGGPSGVDTAAERRLAEALAADERVVFAYLFGSEGAGTAGPRSDVDVAVYLREPPAPGALLDMIGLVTHALHRDDADVVVLNEAPLTLAFETLRGRLLLSKDDGLRIEVCAGIMSRYHDRLPYIRRHLQESTRRIRERGFS